LGSAAHADHLLPLLVTTNPDLREMTPCIQACINRLADVVVPG
jgi:hypothetical protein